MASFTGAYHAFLRCTVAGLFLTFTSGDALGITAGGAGSGRDSVVFATEALAAASTVSRHPILSGVPNIVQTQSFATVEEIQRFEALLQSEAVKRGCQSEGLRKRVLSHARIHQITGVTWNLTLAGRHRLKRTTLERMEKALAELPRHNDVVRHNAGITLVGIKNRQLILSYRRTASGWLSHTGKRWHALTVASKTNWMAALQLIFDAYIPATPVDVMQFFMAHRIAVYYRDTRLTSFDTTARRNAWRGTFALDERAFRYLVVLAHYAIPHEIAHALLTDQPGYIQELVCLVAGIHDWRRLARRSRPQDTRLIHQLATTLFSRAKADVYIKALENGSETLVQRLMAELEALEGPMTFTLRSMLRSALKHPNRSWKDAAEHTVILAIRFLMAHEAMYPSEAAELHARWQLGHKAQKHLVSEIIDGERLLRERLAAVGQRELPAIIHPYKASGRHSVPLVLRAHT